MSEPATIGVAKNTSLADLNTIVAENEDSLGPLTAIGNDSNQTLLTFDTDAASPANHAVIAADSGGAPDVPAGSSKICSGAVFLGGALTSATASRSN